MKEEYFGSTKKLLGTNFFDKIYNICYDFKTGGNEIALHFKVWIDNDSRIVPGT